MNKCVICGKTGALYLVAKPIEYAGVFGYKIPAEMLVSSQCDTCYDSYNQLPIPLSELFDNLIEVNDPAYRNYEA